MFSVIKGDRSRRGVLDAYPDFALNDSCRDEENN